MEFDCDVVTCVFSLLDKLLISGLELLVEAIILGLWALLVKLSVIGNAFFKQVMNLKRKC